MWIVVLKIVVEIYHDVKMDFWFIRRERVNLFDGGRERWVRRKLLTGVSIGRNKYEVMIFRIWADIWGRINCLLVRLEIIWNILEMIIDVKLIVGAIRLYNFFDLFNNFYYWRIRNTVAFSQIFKFNLMKN